MIFNSVTYLLFLTLVSALFWRLPTRPRLMMLLAGSITFYGFWRWDFVPIMLLSAAVDYLVSLAMVRPGAKKGRLLMISLIVNLGLLFYFKYLMFFTENTWALLNLLGVDSPAPALDIILPLGISFYTFQTISYSVDVYRGQTKPVRDFFLYGCYVTFFPQLVAGPILRADEVIPELAKRPNFSWEDITAGIKRVLGGLFLKVAFADNLAPLVDEGYAMESSTLGGIDVWTLAFLFGLQIYFDFSAYSHIAIGSARIMGIHLPENFRYPYVAISAKDFWGRWHISLSSWIRDYLYLPLMGANLSRTQTAGGLGRIVEGQESSEAAPEDQQQAVEKPAPPSEFKRTQALFLTWAIMGFWHGANWTFVVWGLYHAICVFAYRKLHFLTSWLPQTPRALVGWMITLPIMMLGWIPFRALDVEHTLSLYLKVIDLGSYRGLAMRENTYLITATVMLLVLCSWASQKWILPKLQRIPPLWFVVESLGLAIVIAVVFVFLRPITQFIYFQF